MKQRSQNGVSLITAIFFVVVVAGIAAYMVTIGQTQQQTTALSVLGQRAMNAATSGLEWGIQRAVVAGGAGLNCGGPAVNFNVNTGNTFSVDVTCTTQPFEEGTTMYNVYNLVSLAQFNSPGDPDHIRRELRASVCVACP
ncbi:MAG: hypothetical protein R3318_03275 [Gammaproteobacteria bacterium]|nr:hypothetical protein [Gammaproteobacteria bacterium]